MMKNFNREYKKYSFYCGLIFLTIIFSYYFVIKNNDTIVYN